jgi:hypothetical protein
MKIGIEEADAVAGIRVLQDGVWARFRSCRNAKIGKLQRLVHVPLFRTYGERDAAVFCLWISF